MALQAQMLPILPKAGLLNQKQLFVALHDAVRDQAAEGRTFMSTYPQKRGSSSYRRTGTLRNSWSFKVKSGSKRIEGTVGSNSGIAPYNEEVQGEKQDPLFAMLGWRNVEDLEKKTNREFPSAVERIIGRAK